MRILTLMLFASFVVQPAGNVDDQPDWHTCVKPTCDPGGTGIPTSVSNIPSTFSLDGHSRKFSVSGPLDTNALWYIYAGTFTPGAAIGLIDLRVYLPSEDSLAQAFEYDAFEYDAPTRYVFGHQCNQLGDGHWDVWNALEGHWVETSVPCELSKDAWHHIQIQFHRSGTLEYYDSITVDGHVNAVNMVEPSGPLPRGWTNTTGLNIQLDIGPEGATISEYVDEANLLFFGF